jgi:tetratricopeptide (TPR) repeat protein
MVAGYHGTNVTQQQIAQAVYQPSARGALSTDLAQHARQLGFWSRLYRGDHRDLQQKLAAGIPLILHGRFGGNEHYLVVVGTDPIVVHTGARAAVELRREDFDRFWDHSGRLTLLVCPPGKATWKLSADEHNDLGVFLEQQDAFLAAAGHYREALALAPANATYALNLGNALGKQRLFAEAVTAYRQAVKLDPQDADALNNLAWAYGEVGANLDEAITLCERALALRPAQRAYYLDTLGAVLLRQGKTGEAVAALEKALAATTERQAGLRATIRQRLAAARRR